MKNLTIITPTLNAEKFIEDCILSVSKITQRSNNVNHLVVDSGSIDNTLEIIKKYKIKTLYYPPGNIYKAINYGIKKSKADFVTYINSDDQLNINILNEINSKNEVDIITGCLEIINFETNEKYIWKPLPKYLFYSSYLVGGMPFPQSGTIFSKKLFNNLNGFNTNYKFAADYDFFCRSYLKSVNYAISSNILASINLHKNQLSFINRKAHQEEIKKIENNIFKNNKFKLIHFLIYRFFSITHRQPFSRLIKMIKINSSSRN